MPTMPQLRKWMSGVFALGGRRLPVQSYAALHQAKGQTLVEHIWQWELARLARGQRIPFGTSCLAVAELLPCKHV